MRVDGGVGDHRLLEVELLRGTGWFERADIIPHSVLTIL
jgi:hypothetical protein